MYSNICIAGPDERTRRCVFVHGFDFFTQIDGKIHYMEDQHKANHDGEQEERICLQLMRRGRVQFVAW